MLEDIKKLIEASKTDIISTLKNELETINQIIQTLLKRVEKLEESNDQLKQKYKKLLETKTCDDQKPDNGLQNVISEMNEIEARKMNVMILGLQEKAHSCAEERKKYDEEICKQVFAELNISDGEILSMQRTGKIRTDGNVGKRPLKVKLRHHFTKHEIIKKAKNLRKTRFTGVYINHDLTPFQQAKAKEARSELNERRKNGEDVVIFRGRVVNKRSLENFH